MHSKRQLIRKRTLKRLKELDFAHHRKKKKESTGVLFVQMPSNKERALTSERGGTGKKTCFVRGNCGERGSQGGRVVLREKVNSNGTVWKGLFKIAQSSV